MQQKKLAQYLDRWKENAILTPAQSDAILSFERGRHAKSPVAEWSLMLLGGFAMLLGLGAIITANWSEIPGIAKLIAHGVMSFLIAFAFYTKRNDQGWLREALLLLFFGTNLTFIMLIGMVFHQQADPFWALLPWIVISSPVVVGYARTNFVGFIYALGLAGLIVSLFCTNFVPRTEAITSPLYDTVLWGVMASAGLLVLGQSRGLHQRFPACAHGIQRLSLLALVVGACVSFVAWRFSEAPNAFTSNPAEMIIGTLALLTLIGLAWKGRTIWQPMPALLVFGSTLVLGFVSLARPSNGHLDVIGAVFFIIYWLCIGFAGRLMGMRGIVSLAIWLIAIRLFVAFLETFGSLSLTGFGLIITGLLFVGLGVLARRTQKWLERTDAR